MSEQNQRPLSPQEIHDRAQQGLYDELIATENKLRATEAPLEDDLLNRFREEERHRDAEHLVEIHDLMLTLQGLSKKFRQ